MKYPNNASRMPVVILCGGKGARLGILTQDTPKPLIKVGNKPILWHVMKIYASFGFKDFILCTGYKKEKIREYFTENNHEKWNIRFVDTGLETTKSERLTRVRRFIKTEDFFLVYGDDVADIDLFKLLRFHKRFNTVVTITAVRMVSNFGLLKMDKNGRVTEFREKPRLNVWMNGGFMVANKKIFKYLSSGELEGEVFEKLCRLGAIRAYKHYGEWKTMNTLKDLMELSDIWNTKNVFWKTWKE